MREHGCHPHAVSGTECSSGSVRLGEEGVLEGFVQVCIFRKWRPVCSETFDQNAAEVTCRFLGYNATEGNSNSTTHLLLCIDNLHNFQRWSTFVDSLNYTIEIPTEPFPGSFYPTCQSGMESQLTECNIEQRIKQNCTQQATVRCFSDGKQYNTQ